MVTIPDYPKSGYKKPDALLWLPYIERLQTCWASLKLHYIWVSAHSDFFASKNDTVFDCGVIMIF